jgi:hypothetical protein
MPAAKLPVPIWVARLAIFVVVCAFFSVPIYDFVSPQLALDHRGVTTTGKVVAMEPENHGGIRYMYRVDGTEYTRSWGPWRGVEVRSGDPIEVTYLPDNPGRSVPGKPVVAGWWVLPFIVLPGMATLAAFWPVRRRGTENSHKNLNPAVTYRRNVAC